MELAQPMVLKAAKNMSSFMLELVSFYLMTATNRVTKENAHLLMNERQQTKSQVSWKESHFYMLTSLEKWVDVSEQQNKTRRRNNHMSQKKKTVNHHIWRDATKEFKHFMLIISIQVHYIVLVLSICSFVRLMCALACPWVVFCCQQLTGGQTSLLIISDLLLCVCVR